MDNDAISIQASGPSARDVVSRLFGRGAAPRAEASDPRAVTVQYGTAQVPVPFEDGMTVREAVEGGADRLGIDPERRSTYYGADGTALAGSAPVEAGGFVGVAINHDPKGA